MVASDANTSASTEFNAVAMSGSTFVHTFAARKQHAVHEFTIKCSWPAAREVYTRVDREKTPDASKHPARY